MRRKLSENELRTETIMVRLNPIESKMLLDYKYAHEPYPSKQWSIFCRQLLLQAIKQEQL